MSLLVRDRAALVVVDVQEGFRPYAGVRRAWPSPARSSCRRRASSSFPGSSRAVPQRPRPHRARGRARRRAAGSRRPCSRRRARTASTSTGAIRRSCAGSRRTCASHRPCTTCSRRASRFTCPPTRSARATTIDYQRGLERMERAGAVVGTVEAVAVRAARARRHARVQGRAEADPVMAPPARRDTCCWRTARASTARSARADGTRGRRGRVHDRHVRLSGVDDRPLVRRPADRVHLPAHRQLRGERAGDGVRASRGRARRSCARRATARTPPRPSGAGSTGSSDCGVPAISGVDTRALVKHIRDAGSMRGGVFPAAIAEPEARELIAAEPPMAGQDLAARRHRARGQPPRRRATARGSP